MKKNLFLAAVAIVALASCSDDTFVGDTSPTNPDDNGIAAISFGFDMQNVTRGDQVGKDAATTLQNQFIVFGTKHTSDETAAATNDVNVFTNYVVEYGDNTAGTAASNTHNWEYVGKTPYIETKVSPAVTTTQGIKYWDYSAAKGYTFYGIASKADIAAGHVKVTKTTAVTEEGATVYDKGYSVVLDKDATLNNLYVADRKPVAKEDYNKPVTLTFRNFGARVRVGFYETIPGYKVKIDKFYVDGDATAAVTTFSAMDVANTTNFAASLQNIKTNPTTNNTITVSYYNGTNGPQNQVKLAASTVEYNYSLVLGEGVVSATELATSSATPTWDNSGNYTPVYPLEANSNPMLVKVDYTLTAEDGGGETIKVIGANVVIPTQYVQWKSNFAYTYLFKISNNTNGTTDGTTQGLYPITFDAVVVNVADDKTQETITTFEDYSITTYANGSKVTENNEYKSGETIYIVKTNNSTGAVVDPTAIGAAVGEGAAAGNAQVFKATTTGDAISEATVLARLTGSPNGITLTATTEGEAASLVADGKVPAADGTNYNFGTNGAVKFTPSSDNATYVYVFTRTPYIAPTYTAVGNAAWASGTYYFKNTVSGVDYYYPAEGINADNFATYKATLYTKTAAGTAGAYDIKVIKVKIPTT